MASQKSQFRKPIKTTIPTKKDHIDQECKYLHSTDVTTANISDAFPSKINERTNELFVQIVEPEYDNHH